MNELFTLLMSFGKIGLVSLGGGNSMLKLIEYEAVQLHQWITPEEFVRMVGTTFLFPGLTGIKLAALIGYKAAGLAGFLLAILALNIPGLLMAFFGYRWLSGHTSPTAHKLMLIVQYGALSLLAAATFSIAQDVIAMKYSLALAILAVIFFLGLIFLNLSPILGFFIFIGAGFLLV